MFLDFVVRLHACNRVRLFDSMTEHAGALIRRYLREKAVSFIPGWGCNIQSAILGLLPESAGAYLSGEKRPGTISAANSTKAMEDAQHER